MNLNIKDRMFKRIESKAPLFVTFVGKTKAKVTKEPYHGKTYET